MGGIDVGRLSWLCQLQGFTIVCLFCTAYIKTEKSEREGQRASVRAAERERRKRDKAKEFHTLQCLDKIEQERKTGSNC